jgi:hypothetical protein
MEEIRVLTPTGMLGYGFPEENFWLGIKKKPHVIGVDSGSTDSGPQKLGNGSLTCTTGDYKRDIGILLKACHEYKIPVYISSAGGAGTNAQVDLFENLIKGISHEKGYHFRIAKIYAEIDKALIRKKLAANAISPCGPVPPLTEKDIDDATNVVAQMGVEPYLEAMDKADIIISGRTYDPVPITAMGIKHGFDPGLSWHMGKIMECGALCAGNAKDCIIGYLRKDCFVLEALGNNNKCTKLNVAAHTLYEKSHPYYLPGPGGLLDVSNTLFEEVGENQVKVSRSRFVPAEVYTIKMEGAKQVGYRSTCIAGIRDPLGISKIDNILADITNSIRSEFKDNGNFVDIIFHVYGKNGVMGEYEPQKEITSHELGVVVEAVAKNQETAQVICSKARIGLIHNKYEGRKATAGNAGFIFTPLEIPLGEVYQFHIYHLMNVEDPRACFPIIYTSC